MADKNRMREICERCGSDAEWVATWQKGGGKGGYGTYLRRLYCNSHIADVVGGNDPPREVVLTKRAQSRRRRQWAKMRREERETYHRDQLTVPGTEGL